MSNSEHLATPKSPATHELLDLVERAGSGRLSRRGFVSLAGAIGAGSLVSSQLGPIRKAFGIAANATGPGFGAVPGGSITGGGNLIVVYLGGGNDGLNTLIPASDPLYHSLRPSIKVMPNEVLSLGNETTLGLHPSLANIHRRYLAGNVALVRGVGYTTPDLSHFESQAHWEHGYGPLGSAINPGRSGWLGRWADTQTLNPFRIISFRSDDLSMMSPTSNPMRLNQWSSTITGSDQTNQVEVLTIAGMRTLAGRTGLGTLADGLGANLTRSIEAGTTVGTAFGNYPSGSTSFLRQMLIAGRLVNANVGVRVVGTVTGGFDTHSEQAIRGQQHPYGWHGKILADLDNGIEALFNTMTPETRANTTVLIYSEFGRRPDENGSFGTDHGAASVAMVLGDRVNGGMFGAQPSLALLDRHKNLIPTLDFRSVYATLISRFLGGDDSAIIGATHQRLLLSKADAAVGTATTTTSSTSTSTTSTSTTSTSTSTTSPPTTVATTLTPSTVAATTAPPTTRPPTTAATTQPSTTAASTTAAATTVVSTLAATTVATTIAATTTPSTSIAPTTRATTVATTQATTIAPSTTQASSTMLPPSTLPPRVLTSAPTSAPTSSSSTTAPTTKATTSSSTSAPTTKATTSSTSTTSTTVARSTVFPPPKVVTPMPGGGIPGDPDPVAPPPPAAIPATPVVVAAGTPDPDPIVVANSTSTPTSVPDQTTTIAPSGTVAPSSSTPAATAVKPATTLPGRLAFSPGKVKKVPKKSTTKPKRKRALVTAKKKTLLKKR